MAALHLIELRLKMEQNYKVSLKRLTFNVKLLQTFEASVNRIFQKRSLLLARPERYLGCKTVGGQLQHYSALIV
jgi:hypothetical protein